MDATKNWDTDYEWKAVALLTLGFGLVGLDRWIVAPLAPAMIGDLHLTPQDINNLVAALGIAWGVAAILLGGLSDRIGRRKVLIPAIVLFSLLSGFSGMAMGMTSLLMIRAVMGISEGAFCPTSFACVAEASKPMRRGFNQGLQQSAFALFGLGFGPIIATQLLGAGISWRGVFLLVAVPGLILAGLLWMTIREPVTAQKHGDGIERAPLSAVFKHRNVPLGMLALLCAMCGIFVLSANTPIYLTSYLHLNQAQMGFVTSAIGFGGFLGQWLLAWASDYLGRRLMSILGFAVVRGVRLAVHPAGPQSHDAVRPALHWRGLRVRAIVVDHRPNRGGGGPFGPHLHRRGHHYRRGGDFRRRRRSIHRRRHRHQLWHPGRALFRPGRTDSRGGGEPVPERNRTAQGTGWFRPRQTGAAYGGSYRKLKPPVHLGIEQARGFLRGVRA